jgi:hypothetical protein
MSNERKQRGSFFRGFLLSWRGQPGHKKCRLHVEYLKISGFQNPTIIAVIHYNEPFQPHTIYGHFKEKAGP